MLNQEKEATDYLETIKNAFDPETQPYKLLNGREVSELLGVSYNIFRDEFLLDPSFPRIKVGAKFRFPRQEIIEWIATRSRDWYKY